MPSLLDLIIQVLNESLGDFLLLIFFFVERHHGATHHLLALRRVPSGGKHLLEGVVNLCSLFAFPRPVLELRQQTLSHPADVILVKSLEDRALGLFD